MSKLGKYVVRSQPLLIAIFIGIMCVGRLGFATVGYANPVWLMEHFGASLATLEMPLLVRLWAIRDVVLAVLVISARGNTINTLLWACIAVDMTDIISVQLSHAANTWSLTLAVLAALVPEIAALALIYRRQLQSSLRLE